MHMSGPLPSAHNYARGLCCSWNTPKPTIILSLIQQLQTMFHSSKCSVKGLVFNQSRTKTGEVLAVSLLNQVTFLFCDRRTVIL